MSTSLRIYDSLQKQKVPFTPLVEGKVTMYLCGPTTYDSAHIGHAYSAICFDVVRRSLSWLGYDVRFVRNITDVDDKIIKRSAERDMDPMELAGHYADEYNADMSELGIDPPDVEPRVSTHIGEIIALIQRLEEHSRAYVVDGGDVYFSVESFPPYGRLSGQSIDDLRSGARVEVDGRKQSPVDFALWKAAKPGEPSWDSPWGKGRPGWHIECSAMTTRHLGETFDIHAGGKDLIFPHNENEIAQSQGPFGEGTFARYWMHNGFLNFAGEKMSKSIGNCFGSREVAKAAGPEAVRFFAVSHHYRSPANFEIEGTADGKGVIFRDLEAADKRLDYFYSTLKRIDDFLAVGKTPEPGDVLPESDKVLPESRAALLDDFNAPVVVATMGEAAKLANKLLDEPKSAPKAVRRRTLAKLADDLRDVGGALGLFRTAPREFLAKRRERLALKRALDVAQVETLLAERNQARTDKDFAKADTLRDQLAAMGVEVLDTADGVDWRVVD